MRMEPPQQRNIWTRSGVCAAQTRQRSNGDRQNFTFRVRHQCSVQAADESATVARALHEINMLAQKSFKRASCNYGASLCFLHRSIPAQPEAFQMSASVHHRIDRREDPYAENILEKCACANTSLQCRCQCAPMRELCVPFSKLNAVGNPNRLCEKTYIASIGGKQC